MTIFFISILILIYSVKILDYTYQWQIKEYRLDRFKVYLKESGVVPIFIWRRLRLPAKSPRNAIICIYTFILTLLLFVYLPPSILLYSIAIVFAPFFSFILTFPAIGFTEGLASLKRSQTIEEAIKKISSSHAVFIGITGSYGKTITKEYLHTILSEQFKVGKTNEHMNTNVGVALSIINNLKSDTQFFIAEIGAYRKGEVKAVCDIISPAFAILTAIGNQHAALFGSSEALVETKRELLESLPKTGTAFVNKDTGYVAELQKGVKAHAVWFSKDDRDPLLDDMGGKNIIVSNLIPCIMLARMLEMSDAAIKRGIDEIVKKSVLNNPTKGYRGCLIIDNSYNTNLAGFLLTVENMAKQKIAHKIVVSRGIIELGKEKQKSYIKIINKLSETGVMLYTTDADFKAVGNEFVRYFTSDAVLFETLKKKTNANMIITFEGKFNSQYISKMKTYDIN